MWFLIFMCLQRAGQVSRLPRDRKYPKAKRRLSDCTIYFCHVIYNLNQVLRLLRFIQWHNSHFSINLVFRREAISPDNQSYPWYASNVMLCYIFRSYVCTAIVPVSSTLLEFLILWFLNLHWHLDIFARKQKP